MEKRNVLIYRTVTAIFSLMLLAGAISYFVKYEMAAEMFTSLGVSTAIIYPLAVAKILGIAAIWFVKNPLIKQLAYLGFALNLILATLAHLNAGDGGAFGPVIPLVFLIASYIYYRKLPSA